MLSTLGSKGKGSDERRDDGRSNWSVNTVLTVVTCRIIRTNSMWNIRRKINLEAEKWQGKEQRLATKVGKRYARPAQKPPLPTLYSSFGSTSIHACQYFQYRWTVIEPVLVFTGVNAVIVMTHTHTHTHTHAHTHTVNRMIYLGN